jgi:hypothetical protein
LAEVTKSERYEQAIDVYFTSLVVAQQEKKLAPPEMDTDAHTDTATQSAGLLFLCVVNNLRSAVDSRTQVSSGSERQSSFFTLAQAQMQKRKMAASLKLWVV